MLKTCINELKRINAVKFGQFKLKSGVTSPIYVDLRLIISFPKLLELVADLMWQKVERLSFDCLCGVPYTALPIATALALKNELPMVMRRKERKEHGMGKIIEGAYTSGDNCLIVEDVITSGASIFETIEPIEHEAGMKVTDIVVLVDREQGGREALAEKGYRLHSVLTLSQLLETAETEK